MNWAMFAHSRIRKLFKMLSRWRLHSRF